MGEDPMKSCGLDHNPSWSRSEAGPQEACGLVDRGSRERRQARSSDEDCPAGSAQPETSEQRQQAAQNTSKRSSMVECWGFVPTVAS